MKAAPPSSRSVADDGEGERQPLDHLVGGAIERDRQARGDERRHRGVQQDHRAFHVRARLAWFLSHCASNSWRCTSTHDPLV